MPTVKIHIPSGILIFEKPILVKEIRNILDESMMFCGNSGDFGQVILYETLPQHRSISSNKYSGFIFVEILMETGTDTSSRKQLMKNICSKVAEQVKVPLEAVNCCIIEYDAENRLMF